MKCRLLSKPRSHLLILLSLLLNCFLEPVTSIDNGGGIIGLIGSGNGGNGGNNGNNGNNGGGVSSVGCRLVMEKNEWAAGCIPAVNFVVKLVDCGDGTAMSDIIVRFIDENNNELGRDYFVSSPITGQCTVSGYGNIKTITPRGGSHVYMIASCDLCNANNNIGGGGGSSGSGGKMNTNNNMANGGGGGGGPGGNGGGGNGGVGNDGSLISAQMPINGQVTDCF